MLSSKSRVNKTYNGALQKIQEEIRLLADRARESVVVVVRLQVSTGIRGHRSTRHQLFMETRIVNKGNRTPLLLAMRLFIQECHISCESLWL